MNDELNSIEQHAIEAMLAEAIGNQGPPDLSEQILRRLSDEDVAGATSIVTQPSGEKNPRPAEPSSPVVDGRRPIAVSVGLIAVIAATLLAMIWFAPDRDIAGDGTVANNDDSVTAPVNLPDSTELADGDLPHRSETSPDQREPLHGVPLVLKGDRQEMQETGGTSGDELAGGSGIESQPASSPGQTPLMDLTLVSRRVESTLTSYWSEVGVEPTSEADRSKVVQRLQAALGVVLPADSIADPESLSRELVKPDVAKAVAKSWLEQITEGGLRRVSDESRDLLTQQLAEAIHQRKPFDELLLQWLSKDDSQTEAFYAAIAAGPAYARNHDSMVRRLAQFTMNVDLRCTRCHDAYIEGRGRQHDNRSFASFIRQNVRKNSDGQWKVDTGEKPSGPWFYEASDGRQRLAAPVVPAGWLRSTRASTSEDRQEIIRVDQWAQRLSGSPELAQSVVNSLWQLVHGQPLRGRVIDPITAPFSDSLQEIETFLVQDLLASEFDLARSLSLIVASPITRRSVPESLLPENALVADQQEMDRAMSAVDAFAAVLPQRKALPLKGRIAQTLRSIGASLDSDGQPFVAQIGESSGRGPKSPDLSSLAFDLPRKADGPPVQWLAQISDRQEQLEHLAYLAGLHNLPADVEAAAELTAEAEENWNLTLHRVWWMLKP